MLNCAKSINQALMACLIGLGCQAALGQIPVVGPRAEEMANAVELGMLEEKQEELDQLTIDVIPRVLKRSLFSSEGRQQLDQKLNAAKARIAERQLAADAFNRRLISDLEGELKKEPAHPWREDWEKRIAAARMRLARAGTH